MAAVDSINAAITNVAAQIASITANPQPTYSVDGQSVSWSEYLAMLTKQMEDLQEVSIFLTGPYSLVSQAIT